MSELLTAEDHIQGVRRVVAQNAEGLTNVLKQLDSLSTYYDSRYLHEQIAKLNEEKIAWDLERGAQAHLIEDLLREKQELQDEVEGLTQEFARLEDYENALAEIKDQTDVLRNNY